MLLALYLAVPHADRLCDRDGCDQPADFTAIVMDGRYVDHLCADHVAQHMRGQAYALSGAEAP